MKTKPRERTARPPASTVPPGPALPAWQRRAVLLVVLATAVLAGTVIWALPRPIGDLYIALAGGQDVLEGRLGKPDTWSFATTDRVWINQNWGTHLVHYLAYRAAGQTGLLATKAVTIALLALGMTVAARQRGASWPVGLLTAAGVVLGAKAYVDLRPNLTTLTLAPWMLFLLLLARRRPRWVWAAVALVAVWANSHGGFTLGIAMLGLWAACHGLTSWGAAGFRPAFRRHWPLVAATLAAIALAGLANPFGLENLTHGMVVGKSSVWRQVNEWLSIWQRNWSFGSWVEFVMVLGLTAGLSLARLLAWQGRRVSGKAAPLRPSADDVAFAIFEAILLVGAVYMACSARRFMPLAMTLLAPLLARQLEWALAPARRAWPVAALCLLLAVPAASLGVRVARHYRSDNPVAEPETFLERMIYHKTLMAPGAVQFINANNIQGRVFQEWRWEGYLRWYCPQLKLWVGGRAQQVYDEASYTRRMALLDRPVDAARVLAAMDVHLLVVPWSDATGPLVHHVARGPAATWAVIYFDGIDAVVADALHPSTRPLVDAAREGRLVWPDTKTALLSRVTCMSCTPVQGQVELAVVRDLTRQAMEQCHSPLLPTLLAELTARPDGTLGESEVQVLESHYNRLSALEQPRPGGSAILGTSGQTADVLATHYRAAGRLALAQTWAARAEETRQRVRAMRRHWLVD